MGSYYKKNESLLLVWIGTTSENVDRCLFQPQPGGENGIGFTLIDGDRRVITAGFIHYPALKIDRMVKATIRTKK